ncbi:slipin family protein [Streptomyces sp. N2-109]|uniref:Slipin family protein n=1 Tax=Streptomyces gossypii TaxID=2883101 RepID=A0ABT2JMK8_9ACTN|nr:slipin family protein [Streptomyces gossypii]MCT2588948.1 slipin family protein [Streptomyces gossypii]
MVWELVAVALSGGAVYVLAAARVVKQFEQGLVFRLGRVRGGLKQPGFTMIVPAVDRLQKVNMQIVTLPVPAQEGITRDNVTVRVDAVVYFKVVDPVDAIIRVEDYRFAVSQMAQTSLRSIIGKSELDDLLSNREKLNQGLELMIDSPAVDWGVTIDRVEIKDVSLPETMKRSMARQAEATRDRRARVINADAELQASKKLAEAADAMSDAPAALQLRLLQTVASVATEKNSTLVLPFPVELLRFLDRSQQSGERQAPDGRQHRTTARGEEPRALEADEAIEPAAASEGAEAVEAPEGTGRLRALGELGLLDPPGPADAPESVERGEPDVSPSPEDPERNE